MKNFRYRLSKISPSEILALLVALVVVLLVIAGLAVGLSSVPAVVLTVHASAEAEPVAVSEGKSIPDLDFRVVSVQAQTRTRDYAGTAVVHLQQVDGNFTVVLVSFGHQREHMAQLICLVKEEVVRLVPDQTMGYKIKDPKSCQIFDQMILY